MPSRFDFRSQPPEFHPEFGYFWPAAHTRRIVRIGLASMAFGVVFGGIAVLAMTPRPDPDLMRAETALLAAPADNPVAVEAPAPTPVAAGLIPGAEAPQPLAASAAPAKPCNEQTWPYLDSKCLNGTPPKRQHVRIFRPEAPAQSAPAQVVPAAPSEVTAAAHVPEPPVATAKKRQKAAQTRERRRRDSGEVAEVDPRARYADPRNAYASPYERYDRYQPPRRDGGWGW
jgi:hypothetical protein